MITRIHPIECIVPPHMLKEIVERGSASQRDWALRTMQLSEQLRGQRQAMAEFVALAAPTAAAEKERVIYDAENGSQVPGRRVRGEGEPASGDMAADEAYDGSGATFDLYKDVYERNSIDGNGLRLNSTVHYQRGYDNAFWNGQQMVYGDGDEDLPENERLFNRFTIAIDIIGHELTHGVTQFEARLVYWQQPGALNESFSDVFGSLVKQRTLGQTADEADWLIGAGLLTGNVNGQALRSMKAPGTAYNDPVLGQDPQPAHMRDYKQVAHDNGGVHINSGIPNHAFYIVARELGGQAWDKAGRIWYITLRDKLEDWSNFQDAARLTYQVAGEVFGAGSLEQKAVRSGWAEVGLSVEAEGCWSKITASFRAAAPA
jgi:Zn-dependent metalloprotease